MNVVCFGLMVAATLSNPFVTRDRRDQLARITLPRHVDIQSVERFHAELLALVERNDHEGAYRLLTQRDTERRLGAKVKIADLVIRLDQIALDFPKEAATDDEFLFWFHGNIFEPETTLTKRAYYEPHLDPANERRGQTNEIVIPGRVMIDTGLGLVPLRDGVTDLGDGLDLRASRLNASRIRLLLDYVMLAQWEETFHHLDWATYQSTGSSASPTLNRWLEAQNVSYGFWSHCELAPAMLGYYDYRFLRENNAVTRLYFDRYSRRYIFSYRD